HSTRPHSTSPLFPYTTLFRSLCRLPRSRPAQRFSGTRIDDRGRQRNQREQHDDKTVSLNPRKKPIVNTEKKGECESDQRKDWNRSEEHTSELQSLAYLVCRLL